jgi:sigma-B regulation protein RsbU (phosphoserine phosphatase)
MAPAPRDLEAEVSRLGRELATAREQLMAARAEALAAVQQIARLEAISFAGIAHLRLEDVLREVLRATAAAVGSDRAVLLLLEAETGELVARAAIGLDETVRQGVRVPLGKGISGRIAVDGRPRVIADLREADAHSAYLREGSMAGVPLLLDGVVIGVLHVASEALDRFGEDDLRLLVAAAERAALAIGRAQALDRERRVAETLQRSLLPERLTATAGYELAARFVPGSEVGVGGDWYDAIPLPSGDLAVVIGDVAGKGLRAATLMGALRHGLRAYAIEGGGPGETLARVDQLAQRSRHMATVLLLHADSAGGLRFVRAGHLPPLALDPDGRATLLEGGGSTPLMVYRADVEPGTAELAPGGRVVLYTDGLVERRDEPIDASLARLLAAADGWSGSLDGLCDHLLERMAPPRGGPHDDVALIALERRAEP